MQDNHGYFFEFVLDASKHSVTLGKEFIMYLKKCNNSTILSKWFLKKGYYVSHDDCKNILKNKKDIIRIKDTINTRAY